MSSQFQINPSFKLLYWLTAIYGLTGLSILCFAQPFPWPLRILLVFISGFVFLNQARRLVWLQGTHVVVRIHFEDTKWRLITTHGELFDVTLVQRHVLTPWCVIVTFDSNLPKQRFPLVLFVDSMQKSQFHQLRLLLMAG